MIKYNLQYFGGRGSAGGNSVTTNVEKAPASMRASKPADDDYEGAVEDSIRDIKSNRNIKASDLVEKYGISENDARDLIKRYSKPTTVKASSNKKISNLVDKLDTNGTIIGTAGNTSYVVESYVTHGTYTKPDGRTVKTTRTAYQVLPIRRGTSDAQYKTFRSKDELESYMRSTGASWKGRSTKLSQKQKNQLF